MLASELHENIGIELALPAAIGPLWMHSCITKKGRIHSDACEDGCLVHSRIFYGLSVLLVVSRLQLLSHSSPITGLSKQAQAVPLESMWSSTLSPQAAVRPI